MKTALVIAILAMGAVLVGFQVYVMRWQSTLPGATPPALRAVRLVNLALILVVIGLIAWFFIGRML